MIAAGDGLERETCRLILGPASGITEDKQPKRVRSFLISTWHRRSRESALPCTGLTQKSDVICAEITLAAATKAPKPTIIIAQVAGTGAALIEKLRPVESPS